MDIDITGNLNDRSSSAYKNLFRLFSRKAEICKTWKITISYILGSRVKISYPLILHKTVQNKTVQNRIGVHDLIEHISSRSD